MKTALVLVDIQRDFLPGGALAVPGGDEVVPVVNGIMDLFGVVVASQDWHPAGHGSFAANHPRGKVYELVELGGLPQTLWPVHCVQGTRGAEFADGLRVEKIGRVFRKGVDLALDSYSALYDNAHRRSTGLLEYLREAGIGRLFVAGLATDYCVKATALDARGEGLEVVLVRDACRGVELKAGDSARAIEQMRRAGVEVVTSGELVKGKLL